MMAESPSGVGTWEGYRTNSQMKDAGPVWLSPKSFSFPEPRSYTQPWTLTAWPRAQASMRIEWWMTFENWTSTLAATRSLSPAEGLTFNKALAISRIGLIQPSNARSPASWVLSSSLLDWVWEEAIASAAVQPPQFSCPTMTMWGTLRWSIAYARAAVAEVSFGL